MQYKHVVMMLCLAPLCGCAGMASLDTIPPKIEQVGGSPSQICTVILKQQARDLADLRAVLQTSP